MQRAKAAVPAHFLGFRTVLAETLGKYTLTLKGISGRSCTMLSNARRSMRIGILAPTGKRAMGLLEEWVQALEKENRCEPYLRLRLAREAVTLGRPDLARRLAVVRPIDWAVQAPAEAASLEGVTAEADMRLDDARDRVQSRDACVGRSGRTL